MVQSHLMSFSHLLASEEKILQDLLCCILIASPFCLWIGFELFIVSHSEECNFCIIGCEERKGVEIKHSAGKGSYIFTYIFYVHMRKNNYTLK